ncbi:flagellar hook-associated protein FlgK [Pseudidiomarina insulisalsae]|uniref:Flagellar hook-associated protein 1 n=1 Tax=Pseudidiomarina insulisalsae TaxID=575789 RepID=A0A432YDP0_9GAMM|nr:flagellar hook-associated protein FlgK [Pseudidiomarina insulisalsae]RUO59043.1 flagellar hook-associated protein FlgK [Pseudidiomarina insulisalsae]
MSIFAIGLSGLRAAQAGLYTTSNNISNVNTEGYHRELLTLQPARTSGVSVNAPERQFNQFITTRLNAAQSSLASLDTYASQVQQLDNLLADERSGLNTVMDKFFGALSQLAGAPADPAAREGVLGAARSLTAQFRSFDTYLSDIEDGIDEQLRFTVDDINNQSAQIAELNREILVARATTGQAPNSLLNQRDAIVQQLNQNLDVKVLAQESGSYTVALANGLPLVAGEQSYQLAARPDVADPTQLALGYVGNDGNVQQLPEKQVQRGVLGGLMEFRSESLGKLQNQLGQLTVVFAQAMNTQHMQGTDLNQQPGAALFSTGATRSYAHDTNTGTAIPETTIVDAQSLLATDFAIAFDGSDYQVTRRDTGATVTASFDTATQSLSFAGLEVNFSGASAAGDRFLIKPLSGQAANFEMLVDEGAQLAAGLSSASGDNENALALAELQNTAVIGGKATFQQGYGAMVSTLGNQINLVQANQAAQQGLSEQLGLMQQAESGVNLDEEAANLIRYQQYYQANAKVIETGSTLLDTILALR